MGVSLDHPFHCRIFHEINHPVIGEPPFMETPVSYNTLGDLEKYLPISSSNILQRFKMPTASPRASMSVSMCCEWFSTLTWDSSWKEPEVSNPWVKTGAWGTQNHGRSIGFWDLLHMFSGAFASKFRDQARSALSRNHVF